MSVAVNYFSLVYFCMCVHNNVTHDHNKRYSNVMQIYMVTINIIFIIINVVSKRYLESTPHNLQNYSHHCIPIIIIDVYYGSLQLSVLSRSIGLELASV